MLTHKIGHKKKEHSRELAGAGEAAQLVLRLFSKPEDLRSSSAPMGESTVASACHPSTDSVETDRFLGIPKACGLKPAGSRPIKTVSQMTIWKAPKEPHLRSPSDLHTYIHKCALPTPPYTYTKHGGIRYWEWERMFYKGNDWMLIHCSRRWWARMTKQEERSESWCFHQVSC